MEQELECKIALWWNNMSGPDKNYHVKFYEGGTVPIASLTEGAIIRLYFKAVDNLTSQQAFIKYYQLFNQ